MAGLIMFIAIALVVPIAFTILVSAMWSMRKPSKPKEQAK